MKICTVLVFVTFAVVLAALWSNSDATNSTWGYVGPYDQLLHREFVVLKSSWLHVISRDVVYPAPGYVNYKTITAIKAIDRARKNGGYAALYRGGVGHRNVTIHLKSQRSEGLNFTVEIYGR